MKSTRPRRFLTLVLALALTACAATPSAGATESSQPEAGAALGTATRPIVLAVPPLTEAIAPLAQEIADQISALTGFVVVLREVASERELVEALGAGEVHIAWLSPPAYLFARQNNYADLALATTRGGQDRQAVQFLVNATAAARGEFKTYAIESTGENVADAATALAQFADKRPCWTDSHSASGYAAPLGLLYENGISVKTGAFLQSDLALVRSLYLDPEGGVCQFGATYADARPLLAAEYEDVKDKVAVVWVSPPIVPFDAVVFAASLPQEARIPIMAALMSLTQSDHGRAALAAIYKTEAFLLADDSLLADLRRLVDASDLYLLDLLR